MNVGDDDQGAAARASDLIKELASETATSNETDDNPSSDDAETEDVGDDEHSAGSEEDSDSESGEGDDESDDEGERKPKKKTRADRYRDKITRLEEENAKLRSRHQAGTPDASAIERKVREIVGEPPQEKDFSGDYLAWERAMTVYELDHRQAQREVKRESQKVEGERADSMRRRAEDHQDRVADFKTKAKDFDEVMSKAANLKASPAVEEIILDSKKSGHLVYYLAKNPNQLDALNRMTEREAAREVGRIEARLSLPAPKTKTSAPKPPQNPRGGASPKSQEDRLNAYLKKTYG